MKRITQLSIPFLCIFFISLKGHTQTNISEWEISNPVPGDVKPNTPYRLANIKANSFLAYYYRRIGISLAFDGNQQQPNIKLVKQTGGNESIKYDETFAIHVEGGGYLHYETKDFGINLTYTTNPSFEWKFKDDSFGPQQPKNVNCQVKTALFNTENNGYMVYGERQYGPPLSWSELISTAVIPNTSFQTGALLLSLKVGPFPRTSNTGKCSGRITWTFFPIQLTGIQGTEYRVFSVDKYYESVELNTEQSNWWCFYNETVTGLKTGTWKIQLKTPGWGTEFQVEVVQGNNIISFEMNKPGGKNVLQLPTLQYKTPPGN